MSRLGEVLHVLSVLEIPEEKVKWITETRGIKTMPQFTKTKKEALMKHIGEGKGEIDEIYIDLIMDIQKWHKYWKKKGGTNII